MSNYRPVALISTISKVFEKVVYKHIFNFLMENRIVECTCVVLVWTT
jgi:hypothetical protein